MSDRFRSWLKKGFRFSLNAAYCASEGGCVVVRKIGKLYRLLPLNCVCDVTHGSFKVVFVAKSDLASSGPEVN